MRKRSGIEPPVGRRSCDLQKRWLICKNFGWEGYPCKKVGWPRVVQSRPDRLERGRIFGEALEILVPVVGIEPTTY
jgi:hypothetical protein